MKDVSQILKSLGLVDSEIKTYMQALQHGPSTVLDLAKFTNLSRQACYVAIESLSNRGLMSSVERGKKHYYAAEAPSKLLAYAQRKQTEMAERVKDLEHVVPELELQAGGERPTVRFYEGMEGLRSLITDLKESKVKDLVEICDVDAMYKVLTTQDLEPYRNALRSLKTKIRGLYSGATSPKTLDVDRFFLPAKYSGFRTNINVYGDKVAIVTFSGTTNSVIIESKDFAKTMRVLFDLALEANPDLEKE